MTKIMVRLNPDVPPTGSDLGFVNAARRSFNTRSEWEEKPVVWEAGDKITISGEYKLKDKDKRLLEFLARGMTAGDFDEFVKGVSEVGSDVSGGWDNSKQLIELLWEFRNTPTHDTPFNHGFISFEVKAPIFVARQLVKHEYLIMSEFSRRYITDDIEFYEPDYWRKAAENKKQGSLEEPVDTMVFGVSECSIKDGYGTAMDYACATYDDLLKAGVAPEQARMVLPQSTMTSWTWSGTPGAFFKMCQLRCHPEAQYEARIVANQVYGLLEQQWPVSTPLMVKGVY